MSEQTTTTEGGTAAPAPADTATPADLQYGRSRVTPPADPPAQPEQPATEATPAPADPVVPTYADLGHLVPRR